MLIGGDLAVAGALAAAQPSERSLPAASWPVPADTVLIYYRQGSSIDVSTLLPYVAYLNRNGEPQAAPFFDGFLFLSISDRKSPHWEEALFAPGQMLYALEAAAAQVAGLQADPDFRYQVYISLPELAGTTGEARAESARKFVEETRDRFAAAGFQHLQLAGYYWFDEGIRDPVNRKAAELTAAYIHSLTGREPVERSRLLLVWIPYDVGHPNRPQVQEWAAGRLPLDALWLQPNFLWADRLRGYDTQDLDETVTFALGQGASVEIEFDNGVAERGWRTARYHHYLASGKTYGYSALPLAYYEGGGGYATVARSPISALRQLYEETFAFVRDRYAPRSLILGARWLGPGSGEFEAALRLQFLSDSIIPQGLWIGRGEEPTAVTTLRLVEPDPNQTYWLILTFRAFGPDAQKAQAASGSSGNGSGSGRQAKGTITLTAKDGSEVILGTYPLDGELHTRWYMIPSSVLKRGVDDIPVGRLSYHITFSTPVELHASWARSTQWVASWDSQSAQLWAKTDPQALVAQEGALLPGVHWSEAEGKVIWSGADDSRPLLVGIQTEEGWSRVYEIAPGTLAGDGSGSLKPADLPAGSKVSTVWIHPADAPFVTTFGSEGDTAAAWRPVGVSILPGPAWKFTGKPVGTSRRIVGQGSLRVAVPGDGRPYTLRLRTTAVVKLDWKLRQQGDSAEVASGRVGGGTSEIIVPVPGGGDWELSFIGAGALLEAWLEPGKPTPAE